MVLLHLHGLCMRVLKEPTVCKEVTCIISEIYDHIIHNGLKTQQNCIKNLPESNEPPSTYPSDG